jgi:hypothetical protein
MAETTILPIESRTMVFTYKQTCLLLTLVAVLGGGMSGAAAAQQARPAAPAIPPVVLSTQHSKLTEVKVGDQLPEANLASAREPNAQAQPLSLSQGRAATVVTLFRGRGRMARTMLRDLRYDVAETYAGLDTGPNAKRAVTTTAIAVGMPAEEALAVAEETGYSGPVLLDPEGEYFAQVGAERLPRIYVLDAEGKIVWMDIEYSPATRRELRQTLEALTARLRK